MHNCRDCADKRCQNIRCLELNLWAFLLDQQYFIATQSGQARAASVARHDALVTKYCPLFPYLRDWRWGNGRPCTHPAH